MNEKDEWQKRLDAQKRELNAYAETIARLEPDVAAIDASAFYASAAISLKRIADVLEKLEREGRLCK